MTEEEFDETIEMYSTSPAMQVAVRELWDVFGDGDLDCIEDMLDMFN